MCVIQVIIVIQSFLKNTNDTRFVMLLLVKK